MSIEILHAKLKANLRRNDIPIKFASYFYQKVSKGVFSPAGCKGWHKEGIVILSDSNTIFWSNKKDIRFEIDEPPLYYPHNSASNCQLFEIGFWARDGLFKTIEFDADCTFKYHPNFYQVYWRNKQTNKSDVIDIDFRTLEEQYNFLSGACVNVHLPLFMKCLQRVHSQMHHYLDTDWNTDK